MNNSRLNELEKSIEEQQRNVSYDTKEYTIELIVDKYIKNLEEEKNEFFVPEYQREFVWDEKRQSKFIESLIIGLPIPYIFLAENKDGRYEIVDGSQRIRTLAAFINDDLVIKGVEKVKELNGLKFSQIIPARQRKFKNISLKMIVLSEQTTDETKNDIFERINRGSDLLKDMEKRKGIYRGEFSDCLYELAKEDIFDRLTPVAHWFEKRQEKEELLLRFFAFSEWYPKFNDSTGIAKQLDNYMDKKNRGFTKEVKREMVSQFEKTMKFVETHLQYGFAKNNTHQVSRQYFEAVSVGIWLAIKENPKIEISEKDMASIVTTREFLQMMIGRYQTHKASKIRARIDYIKDELKKYAK